ncbi:MAG: hypothetical protein COA78_11710 [Blastopirellula sp.]|nr:MAG: hypothetical protein COA78_11710 [Blastopirellula sp.]
MARYQPKSKTLRSSTETKVGLVVLGCLAFVVSISLYIRINQLADSQASPDLSAKLDFRKPEPVAVPQRGLIQPLLKHIHKVDVVPSVDATLAVIETEITAAPQKASPQFRPVETSEHVHMLQQGESLHDVARRKLGNASHWVQIYKKNQSQLESHASTFIGPIELVLPQDASDNDMIECALHNRELLLKRR